MPRPKRGLSLQEFAAQPELMAQRAYSKQIQHVDAFLREIDRHKKLFEKLSAFAGVNSYLVEIENSLSETVSFLETFAKDQMSASDLRSFLIEDASETLQSALDSRPEASDDPPTRRGTEVRRYLSEIETFVERYVEEIRKDGYDLYHVLIGAA